MGSWKALSVPFLDKVARDRNAPQVHLIVHDTCRQDAGHPPWLPCAVLFQTRTHAVCSSRLSSNTHPISRLRLCCGYKRTVLSLIGVG